MIRLVSIVLIAFAAFIAPRAIAQQFDSRANLPFREMDSGLVLRDVSWGWKGDALPVEVHAPVRLWLDSGDKAVSGTISIEYSQDASQSTRHIAQFATTPGKGTMVEFAVCAKSGVEQLFITIDDGDSKLKIPVVQFPNRDQLGIPALPSNQLRIIGVGVNSLPAVATGLLNVQAPSWDKQLAGDEVRDYAFANAEVIRMTRLDLPTTWIAYESVDVLVVTEDEMLAMPQRQREAIDAWVLAGGRLVLQVATAGEGWRRAVPQAMWNEVPREAIVFGEQTKVALPGQFGASLKRENTAAKVKSVFPPAPSQQAKVPSGTSDDEGDEGDEEEVADAVPIVPEPVTESPVTQQAEEPVDEVRGPVVDNTPELASMISARVATLGDGAMRSGWKTLFAESENGQRGKSSFVVGGPAGFGTVILIGADPDRFAAILSDNVAGSAWRTILTAVLPEDAIAQFRYYNQWGWYRSSSGANETQQEAIRACMDRITAARPVSPWFFFVTAVAVLIMALLVGPVGRIYLKRRKLLTRSWVFALSLIGVACVLSILAPKLVRSGQSMIGRLDVHDIRCDSAGQPVRVATTRLVTMFSGKPESMSPADGINPDSPEFVEGSWWRGVSSVHGAEVSTRFGDPLTMIDMNSMPGSLRSAAALPITMGQWTFRAATQQLPATTTNLPTLRAELRGEGVVRLSGIPANKRLDAVWLYAEGAGVSASRDAIDKVNQSRGENSSAEIVVDEGKLPARLSDWLAIAPSAQNNGYYSTVVGPQNGQAALPWYGAMLPGACRRSHATQILVESGWALVVVSLVDATPVDTQSSLATQRFEVYRIIVPRSAVVSSTGDGRPVSVLPAMPIDQGAL